MSMFAILFVCVVFLYLFYYYLTSDFDYWTSRGVIGPKPVPFFGNIAEFMLGKKCMGDIYKEIYDRYPKEAIVGVFLRGNPALVLRDPEYIKQILIKNFAVFADREGQVYEKMLPSTSGSTLTSSKKTIRKRKAFKEITNAPIEQNRETEEVPRYNLRSRNKNN